MIRALAIAESIVAPKLFRLEFLHRLDPKRTNSNERLRKIRDRMHS